MPCKRESETLRAMRSGEWSAELLLHRKDCPDCREMLRVGSFLRRDSSLLQTQAELPPAMQIWEEAQRRQKLAVLERASRIFLGLKVAGVLYALAFVFWSLHSLAGAADQELLSALGGKALAATIAGVGLAVVFVGGGLWYALRGDERLTG
jgi:predicted anti-sigma-YlaC factor YlaD